MPEYLLTYLLTCLSVALYPPRAVSFGLQGVSTSRSTKDGFRTGFQAPRENGFLRTESVTRTVALTPLRHHPNPILRRHQNLPRDPRLSATKASPPITNWQTRPPALTCAAKHLSAPLSYANLTCAPPTLYTCAAAHP